ncbi:MAG: transcription antitermination factor NusB [Candidatus Campbellbacteria bacterium]|nr:transcription antitermination factor NusB [Candidatus Campbellbacteria bacterium]
MTSRRSARIIILQTLFALDSRSIWTLKEVEEVYKNTITEFNAEEEEETETEAESESSYSLVLLRGVIEKKEQIDSIIEKSTPNWPLEKISIVDRNILRIGLFELLFGKSYDVPERVALNEAIEVAKNYGGEKSGKFINGVLGFVYRELGEPGRAEITEQEEKNTKVKKTVGAMISAMRDNEPVFAMVYDMFNKWTLSKGSLKEGENPEDGILRIIKEELGIKVEVLYRIGENSYIANDPKDGRVRKEAIYFLVRSDYTPLKLKEDCGLNDARWFTGAELEELLLYKDMKKIILASSNEIISKHAQNKQ